MSAAKPHLAWLPNALTLGRVAFIPILIAGILTFGTDKAFIGAITLTTLFILMILTDFLDGFLARKWQVTSNFGRMLDPIADKLFVAGLLITFAILTNGVWWLLTPALVIIGRDIFVSGLREHAANEGLVMSPTRLAKWKTATEMVAIAILLIWILSDLGPSIFNQMDVVIAYAQPVGTTLLWIAAALSAYTGFHYAKTALTRH